mmetsp:Transcript_25325/g.40261  ORF Transcript_25325/g.40261 Transcript_25325/m.40261 type:complete len:290 (-) Transcript_25325:14-883(-)|eukprot:CAMPEP_0197043174 /NCGR_PEP_ID=MMETSP1384-20130603/19450_1 /TAXON_ID=29189 /ORGANISM="Ammonia sp." /LENGTH=289 /DNA_ID=CAMNT_0042474425 /DNA_START=67 /DNA_END=936 /DNA_ORIENTATION=-
MGNAHSSGTWTKKLIMKWKSRKHGKYNAHESDETFFVNYCQRDGVEQNIQHVDIEWLHERRVVFVSVMGLFRSWRATPTYILHSCLVFMPFDREWLQNPGHSRYAHLLLPGSEPEIDDFVQFIRYKDQQAFVFWAGDEYETKPMNEHEEKTENENALIAPFWRHVSQRLTNLYDPIRRTNYSPLKFELQNECAFASQYGVSRRSLMAEMYFVTLKHCSMQEIIYRSNPDSLNPMVAYCAQNVNRKQKWQKVATETRFQSASTSGSNSNSSLLSDFWISSDYDGDENEEN